MNSIPMNITADKLFQRIGEKDIEILYLREALNNASRELEELKAGKSVHTGKQHLKLPTEVLKDGR